MKKRVAGAALFGTGLFLVLAAFALAFVVVPTLSRIPFTLTPPLTTVTAQNATFVQVSSVNGSPLIEVNHADIATTTGIKPDVRAAAEIGGDRAVVWNVFNQTTRSDTGQIIDQSEGRIAMDRVQGSAVQWSGQCYSDTAGQPCQGGNVTYTGQLYAFPFNTKKQTYQYFDLTLGAALPITYQGTDTIRGLPTYKFVQTVPEQQLNVDSSTLNLLAGALAPGAKSGTMWYRDTKTLWIEPMTGSIVNYVEEQHRELRPDNGSPAITVFDASVRYNPQTLIEVTKQAGDGRTLLLLIGTYLLIGLGILGGVLMVLGFVMASRGSRRGAPVQRPEGRHSADEAEAAPVS